MTQEQATTILFNIVTAALAEILDHHGLYSKEQLARTVESVTENLGDAVLTEAGSALAATIRTGGKPHLVLIDGGAPQP